MAALPVWGQAAPANDFNLPAFSAYPLPHVTAAGESPVSLLQDLGHTCEPLDVLILHRDHKPVLFKRVGRRTALKPVHPACLDGARSLAGEYLMMLPTLLESVLTRADADGESHVDGEWLDKVS